MLPKERYILVCNSGATGFLLKFFLNRALMTYSEQELSKITVLDLRQLTYYRPHYAMGVIELKRVWEETNLNGKVLYLKRRINWLDEPYFRWEVSTWDKLREERKSMRLNCRPRRVYFLKEDGFYFKNLG
jgi:hypothetical protein